MSIQLSERVQQIKPSPTIAVTTRAAELKAAGKDVIGLGAGEPDFDTPAFIKQAAVQAIEEGFTKYTPVAGIAGLRQAIVDKFKRDNGLDYTPDQVIVTVGGKQGFFNLFQALLNAGDEVVIPAPYWVSYPDMAILAQGVPVFVHTTIDQRYKMTPEQLERAMGPKTKIVVLNSPSNPSGMAYTKSELEGLGEVLRRYPHCVIATDDMYEHILWSEEPFCNIAMACPDLLERTIVMHGVSKVYSMTGWRIGYSAGPLPLIKAMAKIQSQSTSNATSISQRAAQAALSGDQGCIAPMLKAFKERHDFVYESLKAMDGVEVLPADGTFYSFPNFQRAIEGMAGIDNDIQFAEFLLNEANVALVPGSAFGNPGCGRISFATSLENLQKAMARIANALGQ